LALGEIAQRKKLGLIWGFPWCYCGALSQGGALVHGGKILTKQQAQGALPA
jgi:hypothetical protein